MGHIFFVCSQTRHNKYTVLYNPTINPRCQDPMHYGIDAKTPKLKKTNARDDPW